MPGVTLADIVTPATAPVAYNIMTDYLKDCGEGVLWGSPLIKEDERAIEVAGSINSITLKQPFWQRRSRRRQMNVLDVNDDTCPTPNGVTQQPLEMRRLRGNLTYDERYSATFVSACEQIDPLQFIMDELVNDDWRTVYEAIVLSMLKGAKARAELDDPGSQVWDGTTAEAAASAGTAALNNIQINNAKNLLSCDKLSGIIIHQQVATNMENAGLLTCPCEDDQGSRVYELNDGTSVTVITDIEHKPELEIDTPDGTQFLSIAYASGAVLYGEGCHPKPLELENTPCRGNGDGGEELFTRRQFCLHPDGFSLEEAGGADAFNAIVPTNAELENPVHWKRPVPVDHQPLIFIQTAG